MTLSLPPSFPTFLLPLLSSFLPFNYILLLEEWQINKKKQQQIKPSVSVIEVSRITSNFQTCKCSPELHIIDWLQVQSALNLFFFFFNWGIIALQNFVVFSQTSTCISHRYTYIPSLLNSKFVFWKHIPRFFFFF